MRILWLAMENKELKDWYQNAFEQREADPPEAVWSSIRADLHPSDDVPVVPLSAEPKKSSRKWWITGIAAGVLVGAAAALFIPDSTPTYQVFDHETLVENHFDQPVNERIAATLPSVFHLPDGSTIFLNAGSTLSWSESFSEDDRTVVLDGEAFFKVTRNANLPFVIYSGNTRTEVLGTSFNLASGQESEAVQLDVLTGRVQFETTGALTNQQIVLAKRQSGHFDETTRQLSSRVTEADKTFWFEDKALMKRTDLYREESARAELYLDLKPWWQRNASNQTVISGVIENSATLLSYKEVRLKVSYLDTNDQKVAAKFFTVPGPIDAGTTLPFEQKMSDWIEGTVDIQIEVDEWVADK